MSLGLSTSMYGNELLQGFTVCDRLREAASVAQVGYEASQNSVTSKFTATVIVVHTNIRPPLLRWTPSVIFMSS